jgi:hypothetical protein
MAISAAEKQITAGARTVVQLAVHLKELTFQAITLTESLNARDRGYFLPGEDEQVRHILVSYWHSRAALFEVVDALREHVDFSERESPNQPDGGSTEARPIDHQAFVVGYAAAVLLVDSARSLREMFEDVAVVRDKLNEADPVFGIPQGVYNTVQKSLTSPSNAWCLHQANTYYDENQAALVATAKQRGLLGRQLGAALGIIKELGHRLHVSPAQYAHARMDVRKDQLVRGLGEKGVGRAMYWVQELAGRLIGKLKVKPTHKPQLPDQVIAQLTSMLKPGDVFVTRKLYSATNYFLPGYWPHAILYLGDIDSLVQCDLAKEEQFHSRWQRLLDLDHDNPHRVLEAMADGVWLRSINSPFAVDAVTVIRPKLSESQVVGALSRGIAHESKPYDFDFDFTRSDRLVCTEVVYRSYEGIDDMSFELTRRAGRMTFSAEDLLRMAMAGKGFEPVAVYAGEHDSQLVTDKRAAEILEQTVAPE